MELVDKLLCQGRLALAAAAAVVMLVGCGDAEPNPPTTPPSSSAISSSATASPSATSPAPATSSSDPAPLRPVELTGEPHDVTTDLGAPWSIVFLGETPLISERDTGRILELDDSGSTRSIGTVAGVSHGGEGGLLGLAVDDDQRLYVYSTGNGGNRVQRFDVSGDPGSFSLGDEPQTIVDDIPVAGNHNGGRIAFGPDGMLYVATGDAAQRRNSQDRDSLGGKILRLTPDGDVPDDNPYPGSPVYSLGHRNVQGLAWTEDGRMFATEFGQNTWDELNEIVPGANYGWPIVEGRGGGGEQFEDPLQQWHPSDASPSGLAAVEGTLFIANLRGRLLRSVPLSDLGRSTEHFPGEYGRIRDVTLSPDGDLWFITNNTDGRARPQQGDDRIVAVALDG